MEKCADLEILDISERFFQIRNKTSMSQRDFAKALGLSSSVVSDIERGVRIPSKNVMMILCSLYDVDLNWLILGNSRIETLRQENRELAALLDAYKKKYYALDEAYTSLTASIEEKPQTPSPAPLEETGVPRQEQDGAPEPELPQPEASRTPGRRWETGGLKKRKEENAGLLDMLDGLAERQSQAAREILAETEPPKTLQDIGKIAGRIFDHVTDGTLLERQIPAGSYILGQSIPMQLIGQGRLMVDLPCSELKKPYPHRMTLDTIGELVKAGLLYLNIRDYNNIKREDNARRFTGLAGQNLFKLLGDEKIRCRTYIGAALRKPLFDAVLGLQNDPLPFYEDYQARFNEAAAPSCDAFRSFLQECGGKYSNAKAELGGPVEFRGETHSLVAASWHYAYLSSVRSQVEREFAIFEGQGDFPGLENLLEECRERGRDWQRSTESMKAAARSFCSLAFALRIFHLRYTALITGSWGTIFNRTQDEYLAINRMTAELLGKGLSETGKYRVLENLEAYLQHKEEHRRGKRPDLRDRSLASKVNKGNMSYNHKFTDCLLGALGENYSTLNSLGIVSEEITRCYRNGASTRQEAETLMERYNAESREYIKKIHHRLSGNYGVQLYSAPAIGPLETRFLPPELEVTRLLRQCYAPDSTEYIPLRIRNHTAA
jgi:transcriptional regulator with XRE-family HTH domain